MWPGHGNPWWILIPGMSDNGPGPGEEGAEGAGLLTSWLLAAPGRAAGEGRTGFPAWGLVVRQVGEGQRGSWSPSAAASGVAFAQLEEVRFRRVIHLLPLMWWVDRHKLPVVNTFPLLVGDH